MSAAEGTCGFPVLLAPMAGVSDVVFRRICLERGASLAFTEMVSAKGLSFGNERTGDLLELAPNERVVGVQLFGHEPAVMAAEARRVREMLGERLAVLDINMGCPARKIAAKGDGGSLMARPAEAREIIRAVAGSVDVPVTVKFRRGFELDRETAPAFAEMAQEAGAAALTVHGRFVRQMYRGPADWGCIERVVNAVDIPVVGNGDVTSGERAVALREQTGCDGVMIARAARGNPWIFEQVRAALDGRPAPAPPTAEERIAMMRIHAHLLYDWEPRALVRMRKHASWYVKGMPAASAVRAALNEAVTLEDFDRVFDDLLERVAGGDTGRAAPAPASVPPASAR